MSSTDSSYIHGSTEPEQERLSLLNRLLNASSLEAMRIRPGDRILDLGSGLGQFSRQMARAAQPGGLVIGIERDPDQIAKARDLSERADEEAGVRFRPGDVMELPLSDGEWGSFDLVHCRFLLEHLSDPPAVVAQMVRAARPGGRIVLEDDDHDTLRLYPPIPAVDRLWRAYFEAYGRLGNDPAIGRKLIALLASAGARPLANRKLFFGSCAGHRDFAAYIRNFHDVMAGARSQILDGGFPADELERATAELRAWAERPDAALWYATCWAEGWKPEREGVATGGPGAATPGRSAPTPTPTLEERLTSARFLAESARDLNSTLELDHVFQRIASRVHELIDHDLFCVGLWNEETELLEHAYSLRYGEHLEQRGGFPLGYGISGTAALERRPIRAPDVRTNRHYVRERHSEVEIRSELAVPLVHQDRLIGTLDLESTRLDAFSEEHEQVLSALAGHVAMALDNARLYEQVRDKELRLERDLTMARRIQHGLLPQAPPRLERFEIGAGFRPANELSGDFYDFRAYEDGSLAVILGDVAGKSTPAALYGALAVGMMREHLSAEPAAPEDVLSQLNRRLTALALERRFVAVLYAYFDAARGTLTVANAGTPQPILGRDGEAQVIESSGLPLGALDTAVYASTRIALEPGDLLLFYSDGLEDCRDAEDGAFGLERVLGAVAAAAGQAPQEVADRLLAATNDHSPSPHDDRTLVAVRVRE